MLGHKISNWSEGAHLLFKVHIMRILFCVSGNQKEISGNTGQFYNPAFIHSIAVPEMDMLDKLGKACAVARGDGIISLLNLEAELAAVKPKGTSKTQKSLGKTNSAASVPDVKGENQNEVQRLHLDHTLGGHSAAASCVYVIKLCFKLFIPLISSSLT